MPLQQNFVLCFNPSPPGVAPGEQALIGWQLTGLGNAMLVSLAGVPVVVAVNLDLADDEVAIGGPDSGGVRRLFQGRVEGVNNILETVPRLVGTQTDALGKAEDSVHASGDVGVMALAVRQDARGPLAADGDYTPIPTDAQGNLKVAQDLGTGATLTITAVAAVSVAIAAANAARKALTIQNRGPGPLRVRPAASGAATAGDYNLANGESKTFDSAVTGAWNGISNAAGASAVVISEDF